MTTPAIEQAIEALRSLPAKRQQELAGYIYHLAADNREPEDIAPSGLPFVRKGLEHAKRRQFASPERIAVALGLDQK